MVSLIDVADYKMQVDICPQQIIPSSTLLLSTYTVFDHLKLMTHVGFFSTEWSDTFRSYFDLERSKNHEKNIS